MNEYSKVVEQLTSYRLKQGMSQKDLADQTQGSQSSISRYETKETPIPYDRLMSMGISLEELDQIYCGNTSVQAIISPVREMISKTEKEQRIRVKEGIRYGLEKSECVKKKYDNEIKIMQLESANRTKDNYSVLRMLKDDSGKTLEVLADECKMNRRNFERIMKREKKPNAKELYALCKTFGIRPSMIITNSAYQISILEEMWESAQDMERNRMLAYIEKLI